MYRVNNSSELYHFGIKGQKWGVRRYQNKDGSLTPEGKRRYGYDIETNTGSFTIPAGSSVYRVSIKKKDNGSGSTYVTMNAVDRDMYKGAWSNSIRRYQGGTKDSKIYEHEFKTTVDLKIPSHDEVKKVEQQLKKDPRILAEVGQAWATQYMGMSIKQLAAMKEISDNDKYMAEAKQYCDKVLAVHGKNSIMFSDQYKNSKDEGSLYKFSAAVGTSDYVKAALIRELSNRGYNAMTDEFGVGGGSTKEQYVKEGVQPLLVFDSSTLTRTSSSKVSDKESKQSTQRYMGWYNEQNQKEN